MDQLQLVEVGSSIYLRDRPTLELHGVSPDEREEREAENQVKQKAEMTWDESGISRELVAETNRSHCSMKNIERPALISFSSPKSPRLMSANNAEEEAASLRDFSRTSSDLPARTGIHTDRRYLVILILLDFM